MKDLITLDFETRWSNDYTLRKMTTEEYVRDPRFYAHMLGCKINNEPGFVVPHGDIPALFKALDIKNRTVLAFNAQFDGFIMNEIYKVRPGFWLDPLQMSYFYLPETFGLKSRSLKALLELYNLAEKTDDLILSLGQDFLSPQVYDRLAKYCINDLDRTHDLFMVMMGNGVMPHNELRLVDMTVRLYTEPVLHLNTAVLQGELAAFKDRRVQAYKQFGISNTEDGVKMLRKNETFAELISAFGIIPGMKPSPSVPGKMNYAFSKTDDFMQELLEHDNERVVMLTDLKLNANSSIIETRLTRMIGISERGTMPVATLYSKARTGRWGGSEKLNVQNFKKGSAMRTAIEAPPGKKIGVADSSNIEARMLATWAGQTDLVLQFANKEDAYLKFAMEIYQRPLTKKDNPLERFVGKTGILGLGYGTGANKLQHTLHVGQGGVSVDLDIQSCVSIVQKYRSLNMNIVELWERVGYALETVMVSGGDPITIGQNGINVVFIEGAVILPSGRVLQYPNLHFEDGFDPQGRPRRELVYGYGRFVGTRIYKTKLVENIVQALARDVVAYQLLEVSRVVEKIAMFTHDEIVFVHDEDTIQEAFDSVIGIMSAPPQPWATMIPLAAEGGIAKNYTK